MQTAFHWVGTWLPINVAGINSSNMMDMIDVNAALTVGVVWRLKGEKTGGYAKKKVRIVDANQATASYNRDPLEDAASKPRILAFPRTEPQRFVTVASDEQRRWFFSEEASLDFATCLRTLELFKVLNLRARYHIESLHTVRTIKSDGFSPEQLSVLASAMMEQAVASVTAGIMFVTKDTKVSAAGKATHTKDYKKKCDYIAALAKIPGLLDTPLDAVRTYRDKVVDGHISKLRREHTPAFELAEAEAGPSKEQVLAGGRMRKATDGSGKEGSPSKEDNPVEQPAGKKVNRRTGPLIADAAPDEEPKLQAVTKGAVPLPPSRTSSLSSVQSMAGISPTPLAQAALDSMSGTPKSTPDRPYAELSEKLDSLDAKLAVKVTVMEITAELNAAKEKSALFEAKIARLEQEAITNAAASARRIEELTEAARSAAATAVERERMVQFLHQQQATVWHAFLSATNTNATPPPIPPFPAPPPPQ